MKTILITGGAGFIGKNLIKYLTTYDPLVRIIVFDNFISSKKQDFEHFIKLYQNVVLYEYDIINTNLMTKFNIKIDEIYHFASLASPVFYKKHPLKTLNCGYLGTINILNIAKKNKCKILFASTSEIYGDPTISPQPENYYGNVNSFGERSSYDESKRVAETLCYSYIKQFNLDVKIARIFNTYGPEMMLDDGRIVTEAIKHLINNTTISIYGTGNQTRSLCYVQDTVYMLVKLMESTCNTPVNIGNDIELTVNDIVSNIENIFNYITKKHHTLHKNYCNLTENDPLKRKPCLLKNKQILPIFTYTLIEDGLYHTINHFLSKTHTQQITK